MTWSFSSAAATCAIARSTSKLSVEAAARELRYRWFAWLAAPNKLNAIATGHTLDDQAETVLLKFLRGAGTRGLAGIYPEIAIGPEAPVPSTADLGPEGLPLRHSVAARASFVPCSE